MYEVCKKTMASSGFMCVVQHVMKRPKLIDSAFGDKKFQYQDLNRIDEAVRDGCMAYGLAAVQEFQKSEMFPSEDALKHWEKENGNYHELLLSPFKTWTQQRSSTVPFQHHGQMFTLFGPLRELHLASVKFGDGVQCEAVWMILLPLFAQLQKRNYFTEAFVHIVNVVAAWPHAIRKILQRSCSVSVNGKIGHNIGLDEWVEAYLVQPLRNYASGM